MSPLYTCPDEESWQQFLQGTCPPQEVLRLEAHLDHCLQCGQLLQSMPISDSLDQATRDLATTPPVPMTDSVRQLIERASHLFADAATDVQPGQSSSSAEVAALLAQLGPPHEEGELARIGPYRLLRVLGCGGMGVVFHATDPQLQRPTAVKILKPRLLLDPRARRRFLREAQFTSRLQSDHIVRIYQVGENEGIPYFAMPLLQGESLEDRLRRLEATGERLRLEEVVRIGRECCLGLQIAHTQGLIHRDVKPANLWLETPSDRVVILDFGLARGAESSELSTPGTLVGTPRYMAPEQIEGGPIDTRCDLFSLGCILYRMTTGRLPFPGETMLKVLRQLALGEAVSPRQVRPDLPKDLSQLIADLVARNREARPASVDIVLRRLDRLRLLPRHSRRGLLTGSLIATAAALLGASGWWFAGIGTRNNAPEVPELPPETPSLSPPVALTPVRTFVGHEGIIWSLAFSPDGNWVASGAGVRREKGRWIDGVDMTIRLWDRKSGRQHWSRTVPTGQIVWLGFSPDGTNLHSVTRTHLLRTFRIPDGEEQPPSFRGAWPLYLSAAASAEGRWLAATGNKLEVRLFDRQSNQDEVVRGLSPEAILALSLSPDGRFLAVGGGGQVDPGGRLLPGKDWVIRLWDLRTRQLVQTYRDHGSFVWALALSADGQRLLSGGADGVLRIWEVSTGKVLARGTGHGGPIRGIVWLPDGQRAVTASTDHTIRLWDTVTGTELARGTAHAEEVNALAVAVNGQEVLSGSIDGHVQLWRLTEK